MAATIGTMAILNTRCMTTTTPPKTPPPPKTFSLFSIKSLPSSKPPPTSLAGTALAGAVFSSLSSADPALAAQQLADIAANSGSSDIRGLALLLPIIPAIAWVLFNILQPALNQVNRMRSSNGVVVGLGMGSVWAAPGLMSPPHAAAGEVAALAEAAADNRGQLLLFVIAPAILWVLYNILQPALNQLNKMRSE